MKFGNSIIKMVTFTIAMVSTSVGYAQWGGILGGLLQAAGERWIDNSSYNSQDKDNMRNVLNYFSDEAKSNQTARNAAKDAYEGNYTGAVIQGAQTLLNATGNYSYDTYLNSANQINNANREYKRDLQNGMDSQEALDKRNTSFGYSTAESVIELQDRIARERLEKARQHREAEQQSWGSNNYYEPSSNTEIDGRTATSDPNVFGSALIAHISTAAVLDAMPDKIYAEKELEKYYGELQSQLQSMAQEYQSNLQYYEANQATMSDVMKHSKEKEIVDLQSRIQQFQSNAESEFETKRAELLMPILNKIQNAINAVASENDLSYVIDISTGAAVFLGDDSVDITYIVMKKLGIQ
jgi:outer membrane protein